MRSIWLVLRQIPTISHEAQYFAPLLVFREIQITNLLSGIDDPAKGLLNDRVFHFLAVDVAYLKM